MNLEELQKKINELNVPEYLYSIGNDLKSNAHILYKNYSMWEYFYLDEKGNRNDFRVFNTDSDAYRYLLMKLEIEMKYPPSMPPSSVYGNMG